jgi:hypothetical protein
MSGLGGESELHNKATVCVGECGWIRVGVCVCVCVCVCRGDFFLFEETNGRRNVLSPFSSRHRSKAKTILSRSLSSFAITATKAQSREKERKRQRKGETCKCWEREIGPIWLQRFSLYWVNIGSETFVLSFNNGMCCSVWREFLNLKLVFRSSIYFLAPDAEVIGFVSFVCVVKTSQCVIVVPLN